MNILTTENARDGLKVSNSNISFVGILREHITGFVWHVKSESGAEWVHLNPRNFNEWHIVEEVPAEITKRCENCHWYDKRSIGMGAYCSDCNDRGPDSWWKPKSGPETPLVALDQQNPPPLPPGHPDEASRTLQALGGMCQEVSEKIAIVLDSQPKSMANWDLLHSGLVQLGEMQAIIDGVPRTIQPCDTCAREDNEPDCQQCRDGENWLGKNLPGKSCKNCGSQGGDQGAPACVDKKGKAVCTNWAEQPELETPGGAMKKAGDDVIHAAMALVEQWNDLKVGLDIREAKIAEAEVDHG